MINLKLNEYFNLNKRIYLGRLKIFSNISELLKYVILLYLTDKLL